MKRQLSDQLRSAIEHSGLTCYAICKATGLHKSVMSRFMAGKTGLAQDKIDRIGLLLGLKLAATRKTGKGKGKRK